MTIIQGFKKIYNYLRHLFIKGLLFILPITITFSLFHFCIHLIISWLVPLKKLNLPFLEMIPYYEILIVFIFIVSIGLFLQAFILKPFIKLMEDIFAQVPLLSTVYFGAKQLVEAFSGQNKTSFKDVVYVEFPRPGIYSIGFLTSQVPADISPQKDIIYYNVYIPTTPNPTTGFFIVLSKDQFHHANLTRQEAITLIISGGIVQPDRYKKEE